MILVSARFHKFFFDNSNFNCKLLNFGLIINCSILHNKSTDDGYGGTAVE